jgi:hypothetical protein
MDDSVFLSVIGCAALLLYICSIFLTGSIYLWKNLHYLLIYHVVKFRGEFGVLADDASIRLYHENDPPLRHGNQALGLSEVISVPLEDLRHMAALFPGADKSRGNGNLSAKLFSLKVDFKDA